jgi:mRNA interferase YafQ
MLTIRWSSAFKRDYRKIKLSAHRNIDSLLDPVLQVLAANQSPLAERYLDHPLSGKWKGYRDCHIRPDLLLIYQKSSSVLLLVRLGSHSELF